jgi:MFS family permease
MKMDNTKKLFDRNFSLLWSGQFVSLMGSEIYSIVLILFLKQETGSGTIMGMVQMARMLPLIALMPFAGALADRWSRKRTIVFSDLICGISMVVLSLFGLKYMLHTDVLSIGSITINLSSLEIEVWLIVLVTIIMGAASAMFQPAIDSFIPDIVPKDRLKKANSARESSIWTSMLFGQAIGGYLFQVLGAPLLFLVNGASYILSSIEESFMKIPKMEKRNEKGFSDFLKEIREGLSFVGKRRGIRNLYMISAILQFLNGPLVIALPFYVEDVMHLQPAFFGYLLASMGLGAVIGSLCLGTLKTTKKEEYVLFALSFLWFGIAMFFLVLKPDPIILLVICFVNGVANGVDNVITISRIQSTVESRIRGRVISVLRMIQLGLAPLGFGLGGIIVDLLDKDVLKLLAIIAVFYLMTSMTVILNRAIRDYIANEDLGLK